MFAASNCCRACASSWQDDRAAAWAEASTWACISFGEISFGDSRRKFWKTQVGVAIFSVRVCSMLDEIGMLEAGKGTRKIRGAGQQAMLRANGDKQRGGVI
jgi:hypothetical protein